MRRNRIEWAYRGESAPVLDVEGAQVSRAPIYYGRAAYRVLFERHGLPNTAAWALGAKAAQTTVGGHWLVGAVRGALFVDDEHDGVAVCYWWPDPEARAADFAMLSLGGGAA